MLKKGKNNLMIIRPIVLPKKRPEKKEKKSLWEKKFWGSLLLQNKFRADLHMGEKGGMTNGGHIFLKSCCLPHTPSVLC